MAKYPSFAFYPGDWLKDPNLRRCSPAARGIWIDMICLMFECDERGVLASGGEPWGLDEIACAVGGATDVALSCIQELLAKGVAHRNSSGAIFSRRLVRDEQIRLERAKAGSSGGKQKASKRSSKTLAKLKQIPESENEEENDIPDSSSSGGSVRGDCARIAPEVYRLYPRKAGKRAALTAIANALKRLSDDEKVENPGAILLDRVSKYASSPAGQPNPGGEDFRPYPATWFNQERYHDDDSEWNKPNGGNGKGGRTTSAARDQPGERRADEARRQGAGPVDLREL